jgi:hypothetical protein
MEEEEKKKRDAIVNVMSEGLKDIGGREPSAAKPVVVASTIMCVLVAVMLVLLPSLCAEERCTWCA